MKEKTKQTAKTYAKEVARAALSYLLFLLISGALSFLFITASSSLANELRTRMHPFYIAAAILLPLSFYSIFRAFELHDGVAQSAFPFEKIGRYTFLDGVKALFTTPVLRRKLLVTLATVNLAVLALPYRVGFRFLVAALNPAFDLTPTEAKLITVGVACPVLSLIILLAKTSAHKWWVIAPTGERDKILGAKSHNLCLLLEVVKITVVYAISFPTLPTVFMLILSMVLTFGQFTLWMWVGVAAIILLVFICRATLALSRRIRFLKRMKRHLSAAGYTISKIQRPVLSVFLPDRDEDFTIEKDGKVYTCKLVGTHNRRRPMYISPEGVITEKRTVSFMKITLFHIMRDTRYELDGENKIVIISPMPKKVYVNHGRTDTAPDDGDGGVTPTYVTVMAAAKSGNARGGRATDRTIHGPGYISDVDRGIIKPFETGDFIGDVKFFSPEGFISAIDNDYIGRPRR